MIRGICDTPDRIAARIFIALRSECSCCTFWRGAAFGACCLLVIIAGGFCIAPFFR